MVYANYNEFIAAVWTKAESSVRRTGWRYGQAFFNCLLDERPDIAEQIRGTSADPFFRVVVGAETYQEIQKLYEAQEKS
jgi:hypothetical protein